MIIEIVSPVECKVSKSGGEKLKPCLSFPAYYYKQKHSGYGKERINYKKHVFSHVSDTHCYFWFGLLPRVRRFCKDKSIEYSISGDISEHSPPPPEEPFVPGYDLSKGKYSFQLPLIKRALQKKRGVIKAATGIGKTVLQLGILSAYPKQKCVILAHTLDIISQTIKKIEKAFDTKVGVFGEGKKETNERITVATIQSMGNPIMAYRDLTEVMGKNADIKWWEQKNRTLLDNLRLLVERTSFKSHTALIKSKTPEAAPARKMLKEIEKCLKAIKLLSNRERIEEDVHIVFDFLAENEVLMVDECFDKNTLISTPNESIKIKDLKIGNIVLTQKGPKKIKNTIEKKVDLARVVKISFSNKTSIFCSCDHLFFSKNGWIEAKKLKGQIVLTSSFFYNNMVQDTIKTKEEEYENRKNMSYMWSKIRNLPYQCKILFKKLRVENVTFYKPRGIGESFSSIIGCKERNLGFVIFYDLNIEDEHNYFANDISVHNCHHVSKIDGAYSQALSHTFAPVRLGFTATLPTDEEAKLTLEGLIGTLIEEVTINEGFDYGVLAKPKIKIIRSPYNHEVDTTYNYPESYDLGIVNCVKRNELIINTAINHINEGKSLLIIVNKIAHGENLIGCAYDMCDIPKKEFSSYFQFIQGKTTSDKRDSVKTALINKKLSCVIATTIWCEGVDIPELDVVINAAGGRSEIRTLQIIGRGLRGTKNKKEVIIVDIFDPHNHHLLRHWGERFTLYTDQGWV